MKKRFKVLFVILFLMVIFMPFYKAEAASSYTVEMVANQSGNKVIGTYSSYNAALSAMNKQNSTASSVATIYRDGVPVDSKYAIFKFKPGKTYYLYTSATGGAYTYIHGSSGTDAALLGYSDNGRVKVMISGYTGWTEINNGIVTPISLMGVNGNSIYVPGKGNKIRTEPSTDGKVLDTIYSPMTFTYTETRENQNYTWFKINYEGKTAWIAKGDSMTILPAGSSELGTYYKNYGPTGNLIHHFTYYNGSGYGDTFTNLGTSPSYLTKDIKYYSFDGNYFYSSLTDMLDDYRNGKYTKSVNANSPHYAYYLYLPSRSVTKYSADDLDRIIVNKGYNASTSKMYDTGKYFKEAEATYGQNALMMFSTAMNESANGTSKIAMDKNNLFGYGASDSNPYEGAYTYASPKDSIMDYAKKTVGSYSLATGTYYYGSHYGNKASGRNVKYASDPYWGEKQASNSFLSDLDYGGKDFNSSTIGVVKKDSNVGRPWVFDKPERTDEAYAYTLKNPNSNEKVNDLAVNVIDKVVGLNGVEFYKIYADLSIDNNLVYGYVPTEEIYVSNNQPVITASDKTIKEGDTFNPLEGVTASDTENGNLTNKITYESNVNPNEEGTYKVTYTVVDNSNFHASKTITVKVISAEMPIINASDREIKQFEEFDYMDGVSAKAYDGTDLTNKVTYEGTVNTDVADTYEVTYKVKDSKGKEVSKTIKVTVIPNEKPVINVSDKEIYLNSEFDPLEGVSAYDAEDGEIKDIEYKGEVKTDEVGDYKITYTVTDKNGQKTEKTITVKVIVNQLPVINAYDKTITINTEFNPLEGVSAYDTEDGSITDIRVLKNDVKTDTLGKYEVTYEVTDSYGQTVTKTITVTVSEKVLIEKDGWFHIEEISFKDDTLKISGFEIIKGISNSKDDKINYELILKNQNTDEKTTYDLNRWFENVPFVANDGSFNDYSGSWFTGDIDLSKIEDGDYTMYVKASGEDYYSEDIVSNVEYNDNIERKHEGVSGRGYMIRENKTLPNVDLELFVRSDGLISYGTTPVWSGIYSDLFSYDLDGDNLNLFGTSYALKTNYNASDNVEREVIFENKKTHKICYREDIGSITDGPYKITSATGNDMTRAWFNSDIDISSLTKGTYIIYIRTKVGDVDDYSELADSAYSDLSDISEFDGKKVSLKRNNDQRIRLELVIE